VAGREAAANAGTEIREGGMSDYEIVGPFQSYRLLVDGRDVPFLKAFPEKGGVVHLLLDERYGLDVPVADADAFIPWIADAIAIAMGYTCHPREGMEPIRATPFPRSIAITSTITDTDILSALDPDGGEGDRA
jgi:hypothetical protein